MVAPKLMNVFGVAACLGTAALLVHVTVSDKEPAGSALLGPQTVQAVPGERAAAGRSVRGGGQERLLAADLSSGERPGLDQATLPDPYVAGLDQESIIILSQDSDATGGQYASADTSGGSTILFGSSDESVWRSYSGSTDLASAALAGGSSGAGFSTGGSSAGGGSAATGEFDFAAGDDGEGGEDLIVIPIGGDTDTGGDTTPGGDDAWDGDIPVYDDPLDTGDDPADPGAGDTPVDTGGTGGGTGAGDDTPVGDDTDAGQDGPTAPDDGSQDTGDGGQDATTPDDVTPDPDTGASGGSVITPRPWTRDDAVDYIEQFGIRWTFDKVLSLEPQADAYHYGRFANGDYWIVGPVTIVGIDPASVEIQGRIVHGSEINPVAGLEHGFDTAMDDALVKYIAAKNVARPNGQPVSEANPLAVAAGSSLVSTISDLDLTSSNDTNPLWGYSTAYNSASKIHTAAVLTVLATAPPAGSFRPGYAGSDKTIRHTVSDLQWSVLKNLTAVPGTPSMLDAERWFERPWLDHVQNWMSRRLHPQYNMPDYGREIQWYIGKAALMLHLDYNQSDKETLLVRFVQAGIDYYSIVASGGNNVWNGTGGQNGGRKLPILFAGKLLEDADMLAVGQKSGAYLYTGEYGPPAYPNKDWIGPPDCIRFGEDDQTFYVTQNDVDWTNSEWWNPDDRSGTPEPYSVDDIGLPEWGIRHASEPWVSDRAYTANYRTVVMCTLEGIVLAAHISGLREAWNHEALFDYMDRYVELNGYRIDKFMKNMWSAYRADYPPVWSASPEQE